MKKGTPSAERGAVIFLYLVMIGLVAFLVQQVTTHAIAYARVATSYSEGQKNLSALREQLFPAPRTTRGCDRHQVSTASTSRSIITCALGAPSFLTAPPTALPSGRVDYASIFAYARACPGVIKNNREVIFTSPVAARTCVLPTTMKHGITIFENIEIANLDLLVDHTTAPPITIASPGKITVSGRLLVNRPTIILAGGDISIETLASYEEEPAPITLLSAHGNISVRVIDGTPSVLLIGRSLLAAPPTHYRPPFLLPPFQALPTMSGAMSDPEG